MAVVSRLNWSSELESRCEREPLSRYPVGVGKRFRRPTKWTATYPDALVAEWARLSVDGFDLDHFGVRSPSDGVRGGGGLADMMAIPSCGPRRNELGVVAVA